jgi:hypothetical protein
MGTIKEAQVALKEHEKFIAFVLLGAALMALAVMLYIRPLNDNFNSGVLQILNMIIGAFIGAFGAAAGKLFDAKTSVVVDNPPSQPVPTTDAPAAASEAEQEELPEYAR